MTFEYQPYPSAINIVRDCIILYGLRGDLFFTFLPYGFFSINHCFLWPELPEGWGYTLNGLWCLPQCLRNWKGLLLELSYFLVSKSNILKNHFNNSELKMSVIINVKRIFPLSSQKASWNCFPHLPTCDLQPGSKGIPSADCHLSSIFCICSSLTVKFLT